MKCLVTGSSGFIGSALIRRLSSEGYEVRGLYHNYEPMENFDNVVYFKGDVTDIDSLKPVIEGVDIVFHCAAIVRDYGKKKKFYEINVDGTKNLVNLSKKYNIKRFIFLSHLDYENVDKIGYYSDSKKLAERYLIDQNINHKFPCVIIQPGNVYGPGRAVWVLSPLKAIKNNKIALINHGNGIFLHTYIDNLIDALIKSIKSKKAVGQIIPITDGDNDTKFRDYLDLLSKMAGKTVIKRNFSLNTGLFIAKIMLFLNKLFGITPMFTPTVVYLMANRKKVFLDKAQNILGYYPVIDFIDGMRRVEDWLKKEGYI